MDPTLDKQKDKEIEQEQTEEIQHFKLTLAHKNARGLEMTIRDLARKVDSLTKESQADIKASGPSRIPTKVLHITTRKSPCGNGTNTFDHFEMRIHKRVFHIYCSQKNFQLLVGGIYSEPGMILEADQL
jgi:small subunit ribosomal protein S20e